MPESDFQRYLNTKFEGVMTELGHIRDNTEKINGKVADQEKRIRKIENNYHACPIYNVKARTEKLENETRKMRAFTILFKSSSFLAIVTALGLVLKILNII